MCSPPPSIARFCRLIKEFGVLYGGSMWWCLFKGAPRVLVPFSKGETSSSEGIYLRGKTADASVYLQVVLDDIYGSFRNSLPESSVEVVVDGGAHIGCATRMFHRDFPSARILAIEPNKGNFQLLSENVKGLDTVTCMNAALWSSDGQLSVQKDATGSTWGFTTSPVDDAENGKAGSDDEIVLARSIPSLMNEFGLEKIDLLKLDIEGAERAVLGEGAAVWLPKVRSIVVEVHERMYPGCAKVVSDALVGFSGKIAILDE